MVHLSLSSPTLVYQYLLSCRSTNDEVSALFSQGNPDRHYCLYTYNQLSGRGQIGRQWYSGQTNNITLSYGLRLTNIQAADQFMISILFCLAITDLLVDLVPTGLTIKWPNDIYYQNKKLAGVLIQNTIRSGHISETILGLGLNVNEQGFPAELPNPISLKMITKQSYALVELIHALSDQVIHRFFNDSYNYQHLKEEYISKLFRLNESASYRSGETPFTGTIRDIESDGRLIMETNKGLQSFNFREIEYLGL